MTPNPPPLHAGPSPLVRTMTIEAAYRALVSECLEHWLGNAGPLCAGAGGPEHLHQVRVAMRRLRTVLRDFRSWGPGDTEPLEEELARVFRSLGDVRTLHVAADTLDQLGLSIDDPETDTSGGIALAVAILSGPPCRSLIESLQGLTLTDEHRAAKPSSPGESMTQRIAERLSRLHRQVVQDVKTFKARSDEQRHQLRKRLKRLRYCAEFAAPLFPAKPTRKYLEALRDAQAALGALTDLIAAKRALRASIAGRLPEEVAAQFSQQRKARLRQCQHALDAWRDRQTFW